MNSNPAHYQYYRYYNSKEEWNRRDNNYWIICHITTLFKYDSPMNEVSESGTFTADKLEGPLASKQLSDLAIAGANGTLYVNVHTEQNPNGEIRGQP